MFIGLLTIIIGFGNEEYPIGGPGGIYEENTEVSMRNPYGIERVLRGISVDVPDYFQHANVGVDHSIASMFLP